MMGIDTSRPFTVALSGGSKSEMLAALESYRHQLEALLPGYLFMPRTDDDSTWYIDVYPPNHAGLLVTHMLESFVESLRGRYSDDCAHRDGSRVHGSPSSALRMSPRYAS